MTRAKLTHPRGYLLIETMVSGAILAILLGSAMSVVAAERAATTRATLRSKASALAEERLHMLQADFNAVKYINNGTTFATCTACAGICNPLSPPAISWITDTSFVQAEYPGFSRRFFCREIGDADDAVYGQLYEIGVEVTYPTDNQGGTDVIEHRSIRRDRLAQ